MFYYGDMNTNLLDLLGSLKRGRSLRTFAQDVGIPFNTIHNWTSGRSRIGVTGLARFMRRYPGAKVERAVLEYIKREGDQVTA